MIGAVQAVQSKGVKTMQNSKERDEDSDEITLEYFERWRKPCGKTERIYVRVTPETKERLLTASQSVNLSLSDFVTGATLEAAKFVIDGDN
jgi:hypothetical protein